MGWPTVFVRLTGCPLRCTYCDSEYAFYGGHWHEFDEILQQIHSHGVRHVCVTGGEPLAQKNCLPFLTRLCDEDYIVSLETSGAMDISEVDPRVRRIVDIKTPGSGEQSRNRWENIPLLTGLDEVKFVLCGEDDYIWAKQIAEQHQINQRCAVLFSPSQDQLKPTDLANWIVRDRLPVRFQLQLHKVLWGNVPGK